MAAHPEALARVRDDVSAILDAEIEAQRDVLAVLGPEVSPLVDAVASLVRGGKRLRATFLHTGYLAAGGSHTDAAARAGAAMELFQAGALIHDDVMDNSDTRRGAPSAHRAFARFHQDQGWSGDAERFGDAGAVLAGDLCLVWCDEVFASSGLPAIEHERARAEFDAMRSQLMAGQFLEVLLSSQGWDDLDTQQRVDQAARVIRFKSARYSIEQPLLIGAQAGGASPNDIAQLSAYGLDLGEAFQLRDDILGVFGDPDTTGKPAGDDLREGKLTMLVAFALDTVDAADRTFLRSRLGRDDLTAADVDTLRGLLTHTGAVERVEDRITGLAERARQHLGATTDLTTEGRERLDYLIDVTTARET